MYKLNTLVFNKKNRSKNAKGTDFKQDIVEYIGNNCYIPTSGNCFTKFINRLTVRNYMNEFLTFIGSEKRRSNIKTSARIQPLCRKHNINIGCYDGKRINPRIITERNTSLFIDNNHFCLTGKRIDFIFNQETKNELKSNFKIVDKVISDKHVKSSIEKEHKP